MKTIALACFVLAMVAAPVFADNKNYTYLALGDSVAFGMNVTLLPPYSEQTPEPDEFIGYPEAFAAATDVVEKNASCPGETSGSFLNTAAVDNGCNSPHFVPPAAPGYPVVTIPPFKPTIGLHTKYTGAQMAFALSELQKDKKIDLVTLSIGANDGLLVFEECGGNSACVGMNLPAALATYGQNLGKILIGIRSQYQGPLLLMTYYSPAPALDGFTQAINSTMIQVAAAVSATPGFAPITIVDAFTPFQVASTAFNGDACPAGLLIPLPPSPYDTSRCDIHPSVVGRNLLAALLGVAARPLVSVR